MFVTRHSHRATTAIQPGITPPVRRRGVVLLAVLVVVVLMSLAAYQYSELIMEERRSADSYARTAQVRALAESGIHYTAALISDPNNLTNLLNDNLTDNPTMFEGIVVQSAEGIGPAGRFSVVAPLDVEGDSSGAAQPYRFGVTDEGGKIDLNALMELDRSGEAAFLILMKLPSMTEDIANSVIVWIDPQNRPRTNGADNSYYGALAQPYRVKNGRLDTVDELLLVRGVTPQLLFGNDRNRNGILDPEENNGSDGLDRGWSAYITVHNRERNIDSAGQPRIYVNGTNLGTLQTQLTDAGFDEELSMYIRAYRFYAKATTPTSTTPAPLSDGDRQAALAKISQDLQNTRQRPRTPISSLFDLISSTVPVEISETGPDGQPRTRTVNFPSPLIDPAKQQQLLPILFDKLTTNRETNIAARININTAPRVVLEALPSLTTEDVQTILDTRPNPSTGEAPDEVFKTPAWLVINAKFPPDKLKSLDQYITTRSQVYRVQVMGYLDGGGPTARIEAVIDTNAGRPRIVYWRDLTELGKGFNLQ